MTIYATYDEGRFHIAVQHAYAGSIKGYNGGMDWMFAKLFKKTKTVQVGGRKVEVNKRSLKNFLMANGYKTKFINSVRTLDGIGLSSDREIKMREMLTQETIDRLTHGLLHALMKGNYEDAERLAGEGAEVNLFFWERENDAGRYFSHYSKLLPYENLETSAHRWTPVLYSAANDQRRLTRFLIKLGGDRNERGMRIHFKRRFVSARSHNEEVLRKIQMDIKIAGKRDLRMLSSSVSAVEDKIVREAIYRDQALKVAEFVLTRHFRVDKVPILPPAVVEDEAHTVQL